MSKNEKYSNELEAKIDKEMCKIDSYQEMVYVAIGIYLLYMLWKVLVMAIDATSFGLVFLIGVMFAVAGAYIQIFRSKYKLKGLKEPKGEQTE